MLSKVIPRQKSHIPMFIMLMKKADKSAFGIMEMAQNRQVAIYSLRSSPSNYSPI
jgi:hypothetical protein